MTVLTALSEGDKAPPFTLPADGGGRVKLAGFKGRKLALYFYPKADTEGCTAQAMEFSALAKAFARAGTDILGISADPVARLDAFKRKHELDIPLGVGRDARRPRAYGVWGRSRCMAASSWESRARPF